MNDATDRAARPSGTRSALIAGATGLVGGFLLDQLLQDDLYSEVRALVRRPFERQHAKLRAIVIDFDRLDDHAEDLQADDVFCCLGTTIKKAGSKAAFRKVDQDYVTALARLGREAGARRYMLVSSIGADARSSNFYLSVKGAAEEAVAGYGFPEVHIMRPGQLLGPRQEDRPGERLAILAGRLATPFLLGGLSRFRPIEARTVAMALVEAARSASPGQNTYTFKDIVRLADQRRGRAQES